jgi:hypothetical protein
MWGQPTNYMQGGMMQQQQQQQQQYNPGPMV